MANSDLWRPALGAALPVNAIRAQHQQLEPLITAAQLRDRFLFGLDLTSRQQDPVTGRRQTMSTEVINDIIEGAVSQAEAELRIDIFPVERRQKYAFDAVLFRSFGYMQLQHRPVAAVQKLSITPSNGLDVFVVPLEWIEPGYLQRGQLNIVPLTVGYITGSAIPQAGAGGAAYLQILGNAPWIPAWWQIEFISGFLDGQLPRLLNEYVGATAAIDILSPLAATQNAASYSLGIDGLSQSVSTPGTQVYKPRLDDLLQKKTILGKKIKSSFGYRIISGTL